MATEANAVIKTLLSLEKVWYTLPQYPRFLASGGIGNIFLYYMDEGFLNLVLEKIPKDLPTFFEQNKESVSFFTAYLAQIVIQHYLHAMLAFGRDTINTREKYLKTLKSTYATLSGILVGSTIMNGLLLKAGVNKKVAFWVTLYGFGFVSYLILKLTSKAEPAGDSSIDKVNRGGASYTCPLWKNVSNAKHITCSTVDSINWETLLRNEFSLENSGMRNWGRLNGVTKTTKSSY